MTTINEPPEGGPPMSQTAAAVPAGIDPATGEVKSKEPPRPFVAVLNDQREGALADELAEQLSEVVNAVIEHEKAGTVTLTLKVNPTDLGDRSVVIVDDVKSKVPQAPKEKTLFFAGKTGDLSRRNPRQMELEVGGLREVPHNNNPKEIK